MGVSDAKRYRLLDIFFRAMRGEDIVVHSLAHDYGVTSKSISRDISDIRNFLAENRDLVDNVELKYMAKTKSHRLEFNNFLLSKELLAIIKILIGSRAFSHTELLEIIGKLKHFTTVSDRKLLEEIILKEIFHYNEVNHDCKSVIDTLWQLTRCIYDKREITISYYKMQREKVERRLRPIAVMFSEYYFYLIGLWILWNIDNFLHCQENAPLMRASCVTRYNLCSPESKGKLNFLIQVLRYKPYLIAWLRRVLLIRMGTQILLKQKLSDPVSSCTYWHRGLR